MKTLVRCDDRMVFEINPITTEAVTCSYYDAYCFSDPRQDVIYISYYDWLDQREKRYKQHFGVE